MIELLCASPLQRDSDFFKESGAWVTGACPATALANAASSALGRRITPQSVYELMRAHGLCDPDGAATIGDIQEAALLLGCKVAAYRPYSEPWTDWESWLIAQVTHNNPVVIEGAYSQALNDSITGLGENYVGSLLYHFWDVVGYFSGGATSPYAETNFNKLITTSGFWCGDGDNWAGGNGVANNFNAANQLQFYATSVITAARPCAALALVGRTITPVWTTQTNGDGKDGAGHDCSAGFMKAMAANPSDMASDGLASSIALPNNTAFLALENGTLYIADPPDSPFKRFALPGLAQEWMKMHDCLVAASAPPPPAPLSPADQAAINAVAALKAALA